MSEQTSSLKSEPRRTSGGKVAGAILILVGVMALVQLVPGLSHGAYFLPVIGLAFFAGGFIQRRAGLFIPGGALLGLWTGFYLLSSPLLYRTGFLTLSDGLNRGGVILLGLAGGFILAGLASLLVGSLRVGPLVAGAVLAVLGTAMVAGQPGLDLLYQLRFIWPAGMIVLGGWLVLSRIQPSK